MTPIRCARVRPTRAGEVRIGLVPVTDLIVVRLEKADVQHRLAGAVENGAAEPWLLAALDRGRLPLHVLPLLGYSPSEVRKAIREFDPGHGQERANRRRLHRTVTSRGRRERAARPGRDNARHVNPRPSRSTP
jgi:hypothetical protein